MLSTKKIKLLLFQNSLLLMLSPCVINAQAVSSNQSWNEIHFTRAWGPKWASEIDMTFKYSNTSDEHSIFAIPIQSSFRGWAHYHASSRWKLSTFLAYYYNTDEPDIVQQASHEWRVALQGIYFLHKTAYTLSTRGRFELRFLSTEDNTYNEVYRYRQQLKYQKPINSKVLRKGIFYIQASDELFFKSTSKTTGLNHFDRNRITIGGGYVVTDNLQVELNYVNEFLPRDNQDQVVNALYFIITYNNLLPTLKKKIFGKTPLVNESD